MVVEKLVRKHVLKLIYVKMCGASNRVFGLKQRFQIYAAKCVMYTHVAFVCGTSLVPCVCCLYHALSCDVAGVCWITEILDHDFVQWFLYCYKMQQKVI